MISSDFKQRAAEISTTWGRFLEFVEQSPDSAKPMDMTGIHCDYPVQSWPTFISTAQRDEIARATTSVFRLLRTIPRVLFNDDAARIADYYRIRPAALAPALLSQPHGLDIAIGRADFIHSESGFKCVEFNPFGSLGGLETEFMFDAYQHTHAYSRFVASSGIRPRYDRCMLKLFEYMIRVALDRGIGSDTVNVAVVADGDRPAFGVYGDLPHRVFREALSNVGVACGTLVQCRPQDIKERGGDLYCGDARLHVVWEYAVLKHYPARLVMAYKRGRIAYFNMPLAGHLGCKRNLALLSQALDSDLYDADDRAAISRYIPWSREVTDREVVFGDRRMRLMELLHEQPAKFVLKRGQGYGGEQVFIGHDTAPARWEQAIRMAFEEGGWMAQEFIRPRTFAYQSGDEGAAPCNAVWGTFCFGDEFGGAYLRIMPDTDTGPINSARGAMTGFVFEA